MAQLPKRFVHVDDVVKINKKYYRAVLKDMTDVKPKDVCNGCDLLEKHRCIGQNIQCSPFDRIDKQWVNFKLIDTE